MTQEAS